MSAAVGLLWPVCLLLVGGDELPADVQVRALKIVETRVVEFEKKEDPERMSFSFDHPGVTLTIGIKGPSAIGASHWGFLKIESSKDDQGREIKLGEEGLSFHDPREEFLTLDRDAMSMGGTDLAKDELRLDLPLTLPARDAKSISVRGQFKLKVVEPRDVLAADRDAEGDVKHEVLEQAGLRVKIKPVANTENGVGFVFEVNGPLERVLDTTIVDAAGRELETQGRQRMSSDDQAEYTVWLTEAPPADARLKLSIAVKEAVSVASFELKDVRLP